MLHRAISLVAALVIALLCTVAAAQPLSARLSTAHFVVHYERDNKMLAMLVGDESEEQLARIALDLGYDPAGEPKFDVYAYPTRSDFIEAGGTEISKFTAGTTRVGDASISVDASATFMSTRTVIAHEITHAVMFRILGSRVGLLPLWFHEGVAKVESHDIDPADRALVADAAADGSIIPLNVLKYEFPQEEISLAYAQSALAIEYLTKSHGQSAPKKILHALAKSGSLDQAFSSSIGITPQRFVDNWDGKTGGKYAFVRISRIAAGVGSVIMAILAIIAFAVRRSQMRKAAEIWESEQMGDY